MRLRRRFAAANASTAAVVAGVTALCLIAALVSVSAQAPTLPTVMNEKSANAERLVRPVVRADFDEVSRYAERLARLTFTEVSSWQAQTDAEYVRQANAFVRSVQALREGARARDAGAVLDAYTALISSCAQCHRLTRRQRSVSLTPPAPVVTVPPGAGGANR